MLLIGSTSILGYHMVKLASEQIVPVCHVKSDAWAAGSVQVDMDDPLALAEVASKYPGQTVVYAHAVCNVNKCERNPNWAHQVNVENLRQFLEQLPQGVRLVYLSSDHVFGDGGDCDETTLPKPISVYGQTRVAAETLVLQRANSLVIRSSLALGDSHNGRSGHWNWLNFRLKRGLPVTLITDEARTTVWAPEAAWRIMELTHSSATGMVHLANNLYCYRDALAKQLCEIAGLEPRLKWDQRVNQSYPHLGQVRLISNRKEGQLTINPLEQIRLHVESGTQIV
ncbi:MAG: sugar nucleotide-binding protein [Phycisphaeraceae bacterium]|nr:sugar nucleotide-binding protein [Phycisphaeraceae bacterium]